MMQMFHERGFSRLMILFSILDRLSRSNEVLFLATEGYKRGIEQPDADRINEVYEFIVDHFDEHICLEELASRVNMSSSAFCRYLRSRIGKSFKQMLNEIRIGHACREILETEKTITQIAYDSGYNNISNFNRRFREMKNLNPLEFRSMYKNHTK
jgi:AraC-like DNA-binding protein